MTQINGTQPIKIKSTTPQTITLELDSSGFGDYERQGLVENVKVPNTVSFHSWEQSYKNPAASTQYGFLEPPDLAKFGRSEQLHIALYGIIGFVKQEGRYPENNEADLKKAFQIAEDTVKANLAADENNLKVE